MMRFSALVLLLMLAAGGSPGAGEVLNVSPDGPLASLTAARDAVRKLRSTGLIGRVRIVIADGTYRLSEAFTLAPEDSDVTYEAAPGARPVFTGGRAITGWQKGTNGVWTAQVPDAAAGKWYFSQLFVNGRRCTRARTPNSGYFTVVGRAPQETGANAPLPYDPAAFLFKAGDLKQWSGLEDANVVVLHYWESTRLRIKSLDIANSIVRFTGTTTLDWWLKLNPRPLYWIENIADALDAPGEWYLDRKSGTLSYRPMRGEDMRKAEVIAPAVPKLVILAGDPDSGRFVEDVKLIGLVFEHADWSLEPEGHGDPQAAVSVEAAFQADGARRCTIEQCRVAYVGTYGVWFRRGCTGNRIDQCEIADTGAGGVRIGEPRIVQKDTDKTSGNTIYNCYIHGGGHVYPGAIGVWIGESPGNTISHCEICDHQYSGISIGWTWGYGPSDTAGTKTEYNHIHHLGQAILTDMGAIYNLGASPGSVIRGNHIHDVWGGGIYPDEGSAGLTIENNLVYRCLNGAFTLHYGKDNTVRNNIFALGLLGQVVRHRNEPHRAWTFQRNIVYSERQETMRSGTGGQYDEFDHNLYWNSAGGLVFPGDLSFAEWQTSGKDAGSVAADPLFVNAKKDDFRLKPDSPALKLGFVPIDLSSVGLVGEQAWTGLPKRTPLKPFSLARPWYQKPEAIDDGFETTPVGLPALDAATYGETDAATVRVTEETAASGKRSLKFVDAPNLDYAFNPHVVYSPRFESGLARCSFDLRWENGAVFWHEWRDSAVPYRVGPSIHTDGQGALYAGDRKLADLPPGQWVHIEAVCWLGKRSTGKFDLAVTLPGGDVRRFDGLPCDPRFNRLDWLGFVSNATDKAVFYIDNVSFRTQ